MHNGFLSLGWRVGVGLCRAVWTLQVKPTGMEQIWMRCGKKILFSPDLWLLRVISQDLPPLARLSKPVI